MRIRRPSPDARVVTKRQWFDNFADLDELVRPVVVRVNDVRDLVTIRPKNSDEIQRVKVARGLPLTDRELVTKTGSLLRDSPRTSMEEIK